MRASRLQDRLRRPWAVWLALCVALLGALAVPMAHAVPRGDSIGLMEVCTSTGTQVLDANGADLPSESAPFLAHCPFCLQPPGHAAAPPQQEAYSIALVDDAAPPSNWLAPAIPDRAVPVPPPRGPPAFS